MNGSNHVIYEIIKRLYPTVYLFSRKKSDYLWNLFRVLVISPDGWGINRQSFDKRVEVGSYSEIEPLLEKLLGKNFDRTIYLFELGVVIKTLLELAIENLEDIFHVSNEDVFLWNPGAGYIVQRSHDGKIFVGIVSSQVDPYPVYSLERETDLPAIFEKRNPFRVYLKSYGLEIIPDDEADRVVSWFLKKYPLTKWGTIDWKMFPEKVVHHNNAPEKILPTLEVLINYSGENDIYLLWNDAAIPLIKTDILSVTRAYNEVRQIAHEFFVFNVSNSFVISITAWGDITVGVLPK